MTVLGGGADGLNASEVVDTTGNPSTCYGHFDFGLDQTVGFIPPTRNQLQFIGQAASAASAKMVCNCAGPYDGVGFGTPFSFCWDSVCSADAIMEFSTTMGLKNSQYSPEGKAIASGESITFTCNKGYRLKNPNGICPPQGGMTGGCGGTYSFTALCRGGYFLPQQPPQCVLDRTDTEIYWIILSTLFGLLLVLNSWVTKNYLVHDRLVACPSSPQGLLAELGLTMLGLVPGGTFFFAKRYKHVRDAENARHHYNAELQEKLIGEKDLELQEFKLSWKIEWHELTLGRVLGSGAYGEVCQAGWAGNEVAVKRMIGHIGDDTSTALFEAEASTMVGLRHPNVVSFFGAGIESNTGEPFIVTELMTNGTLKKLMHSRGVDVYSWAVRKQFCAEYVFLVFLLSFTSRVYKVYEILLYS